MAYSASIGNRNPQFILRRKLKHIAEVTQAPILFHLSLVKFHTLTTPVPMLQLSKWCKVMSWERDPTTYLVSATSFNGTHRPFCEPCVGTLRFPLVSFFPSCCSRSWGISCVMTLGGAKPPSTMTHCTLYVFLI
jgi:hypothetical protein